MIFVIVICYSDDNARDGGMLRFALRNVGDVLINGLLSERDLANLELLIWYPTSTYLLHHSIIITNASFLRRIGQLVYYYTKSQYYHHQQQ
jgi:hypothetical protein